ncbi:hypothetical protein CNEO2_40109 [Clostridium neonatale]|nr:hypothetical protein CNEO2_100061 [Clostridium neonatale]CAI3210943.1 hypothetical protein CNEO2_90061 [Clostridium neonatale]CAI3245688.1 hypothetical protein CNEO2_40109 [Clostridium neonatale]
MIYIYYKLNLKLIVSVYKMFVNRYTIYIVADNLKDLLNMSE